MATYFVEWNIELDAESHLEAAKEALRIQRDPDSIATIFTVTKPRTGNNERIIRVIDVLEAEKEDNRNEIRDRLEYLRGEIEAERISYGELAELQSLAEHIDPGDVLLLEWAGVSETREQFYECGICGAFHRVGFDGDCRDDRERFATVPDGAEIVTMEEIEKEDLT